MSEERDTRDTEPPAFAEMDPKALLVYMADAMFEMRQTQRVQGAALETLKAEATLIGNSVKLLSEDSAKLASAIKNIETDVSVLADKQHELRRSVTDIEEDFGRRGNQAHE